MHECLPGWRQKDSAIKNIIRLWKSQDGAVAVFAVFAFIIVMVTGVLALDVGRLVMAINQMQNAADSAALSGATQLDGRSNAITRATAMAQSTLANSSAITQSSDLSVYSVAFYQDEDLSVPAVVDAEAHYIQLSLTPQTMSLFFTPLLSLLQTTGGSDTTTLNATAAARLSPIVCNAAPFMACDPAEYMTAADSLLDTANAGRQVLIKEGPAGGGPMAPGNFGLLCTTDGSCGASAIGDALAATTIDGCYGSSVTTSPGKKTNQVRNGMNARFDQGNINPANPAPNVISFPNDTLIDADPNALMGDGNWDRTTYWSDKHGGASVPADLGGGSRFQFYLYELGETYWMNGTQTIYPTSGSLPAGWTEVAGVLDIPVAVDPADASDPDYDGEPETIPVNDPLRRVVRIAVLQCLALNVRGSGTFPTYGKYVQMFITGLVSSPPGANIYGEIIGPMTEASDEGYHANVELVR